MAERCPDCGVDVDRVAVPGSRSGSVLVDAGPGATVHVLDMRADGSAALRGVIVAGLRLHSGSCAGADADRQPKASSPAAPAPIRPVTLTLPGGQEVAPADVGALAQRVRSGDLRSIRPDLRAIARALLPLLDEDAKS